MIPSDQCNRNDLTLDRVAEGTDRSILFVGETPECRVDGWTITQLHFSCRDGQDHYPVVVFKLTRPMPRQPAPHAQEFANEVWLLLDHSFNAPAWPGSITETNATLPLPRLWRHTEALFQRAFARLADLRYGTYIQFLGGYLGGTWNDNFQREMYYFLNPETKQAFRNSLPHVREHFAGADRRPPVAPTLAPHGVGEELSAFGWTFERAAQPTLSCRATGENIAYMGPMLLMPGDVDAETFLYRGPDDPLGVALVGSPMRNSGIWHFWLDQSFIMSWHPGAPWAPPPDNGPTYQERSCNRLWGALLAFQASILEWPAIPELPTSPGRVEMRWSGGRELTFSVALQGKS